MHSWHKAIAALALAALLSAPAAVLGSCTTMLGQDSRIEPCPAHVDRLPKAMAQRATPACCSFQAPTAPANRAEVRIVDEAARILELAAVVAPQADSSDVLPAAAFLASRAAPQRFFALLI